MIEIGGKRWKKESESPLFPIFDNEKCPYTNNTSLLDI